MTVIALAHKSDLSGAYGKSSPRWGRDWIEARSCQPHQITCVRALPLPGGYLAEPAEQFNDAVYEGEP